MDIQGSIAAVVTPMHEDGSMDFTSYKNLIDWHIEQGTDSIVAVGTTGESATLNVEEHTNLIDFTVKYVNKRIPVIAGTGGNSTSEAIELTEFAKKVGADASLQVVPYYNKPTQEGIYQHYKKIAETVDIPVILYNVPGRTVADMSNDTVVRLAGITNIIGIKDATGNLDRGCQLIKACQEISKQKLFNIYSGDDATAALLMLLGAKGNISVTANILPNAIHNIAKSFINNVDLAQATAMHINLSTINSLLFCEANPIPVKYALYKMGRIPNGIRLPLTELSDSHKSKIDAELKNLGLI
jgi:4-hydroxy-tetrahydrodipicolinate synthase